MRSVARAVLGVAVGLCGWSPAARAEEFAVVGPRAMGMGGAGVATTRGGLSTYWNPAGLAPPETPTIDYGTDLSIHASASGAATEDVLRELDDLADAVQDTDFDALADALESGRALTPDEIQDVMRLVDAIPDLGTGGTGLVANLSPGFNFRFGRFGLSGMLLTHAGGVTNVDTSSLALGNQGLEDVITGSNTPTTPEGQALADDLEASLSAQGVPEATRVANEVAFQAEQAGVGVDDPAFQDLLQDVLDASADASGDPVDPDDFLTGNQSGVDVRGIALQEYGLSYARPFFELVSVGATAKLLYGTTYYNPFTLGDLEGFDDVYDEFTSGQDEEQFEYALDLGVLAQPIDGVSVGVVGKYLNQPSFEFGGPGDYDLEPQVRGGVAVGPLAGLTLAADLDLVKNSSEALPGYDSQVIGGGLEYGLFDVLFLRGGVSKNLAESSEDPVFHAGLGLRVFGVSVDAAGMVSPDFAEIDGEGTEVPERAGASLMLSVFVPLD